MSIILTNLYKRAKAPHISSIDPIGHMDINVISGLLIIHDYILLAPEQTVYGLQVLEHLFPDNFRRQEFHKKSMELLRGYTAAQSLLGQPITARRLDLGGLIENYTDGLEARVCCANQMTIDLHKIMTDLYQS